MKTTNPKFPNSADLAFWQERKRPKWAHDKIKNHTLCSIDSVIGSHGTSEHSRNGALNTVSLYKSMLKYKTHEEILRIFILDNPLSDRRRYARARKWAKKLGIEFN